MASIRYLPRLQDICIRTARASGHSPDGTSFAHTLLRHGERGVYALPITSHEQREYFYGLSQGVLNARPLDVRLWDMVFVAAQFGRMDLARTIIRLYGADVARLMQAPFAFGAALYGDRETVMRYGALCSPEQQKEISDFAAWGGHRELMKELVVKWNAGVYTERHLSFAGVGGHISLLRYIHDDLGVNSAEAVDATLAAATKYASNIPVIRICVDEWLNAKSFYTLIQRTLTKAVENGFLDVVLLCYMDYNIYTRSVPDWEALLRCPKTRYFAEPMMDPGAVKSDLARIACAKGHYSIVVFLYPGEFRHRFNAET